MAATVAEVELAVITMVQAKDFPSAWSSISPVEAQLSARRPRFILFNDLPNPSLEKQLASLDHTQVLTPGDNLGVARGRNVLFEAALSTGARYIVSIDADLYVPSDYLDVIEQAAASVDDGPLGVMAPTVLRLTEYALANPDLIAQSDCVEGRIEATAPSRQLRRRIDSDDHRNFYHLGTRGWRDHYLAPTSLDGIDITERLQASGFLDHGTPDRPTWLAADSQRRVAAQSSTHTEPVDTLPGGASLFSTAMLRDIGLCDDRFSPFGHEDADLCIRALGAGYHNLWVPTTVLLHDFQNRGDTRTPEDLAFIRARAKAILASNHAADEDLAIQIVLAIAAYPLDAQAVARHRTQRPISPGEQLSVVAAHAAGYVEGMTAASTDRPSAAERLARLSGGDILQEGPARRWIIRDIPIGVTDSLLHVSGELIRKEHEDRVRYRSKLQATAMNGTAASLHLEFSELVGRPSDDIAIGRMSLMANILDPSIIDDPASSPMRFVFRPAQPMTLVQIAGMGLDPAG